MEKSFGVGRAFMRTAMAMLLGVIGLGSILAPASTMAAQRSGLVDDTTYISETSGEEITWGGDWAFDSETSFVESSVERVALTGDAGLLDVIYFPPGIDLASTRDDLFDLLTNGADDTLQIDRGDYQGSSGRVSYSLDKVLVGDVELAMFTLLMERRRDTFITVFYSTPDLFFDGMTSAQRNIDIDGLAIFQGIRPGGLANALDGAPSLLDGATSRSSSRTSTTDATETPEDRSSRSSRDETPTAEDRGSRTSRDETPTAEDRSSRSSRDETPTAEDRGSSSDSGSKKTSSGSSSDFADLGVTGDGSYESPQYGIPVEWSSAWLINEQSENPVSSDTSTGTDQIKLIRADSSGSASYGALSVRFFEAGSGDTPATVVDYWTSKDYLNGGAGDGSTVLLADSSKTEGSVVLISTLDNGDTFVQYLSVFFLDRGRTAVMIEFYSTDQSIADAYADAADGITVDGEPILTLFNDRDIEDALANQ